MADEQLIPPGIQDENTLALAGLIERLSTIDLSPLLVYRITDVSASALPHLAEQFHVLGYEGWKLAVTEADKRNLVSQAIALHRFKGTPWSIKEAIKAVGFTHVTVLERVGHWTEFSVFVTGRPLQAGDSDLLRGIIGEYSPARCKLVVLGYGGYVKWGNDGTWGADERWGEYQAL